MRWRTPFSPMITRQMRKGIVLAGGSGSRLYPMTKVISKQLLPVFDKPMIYYPLTTLMLAKIREILIISTPAHLPLFEDLLGDGSQWGLSFHYAAQANPTGLPDAFVIGRDFINGAASALVLGDNIFYGQGLTPALDRASADDRGATIFGYHVRDPQRYGVLELEPPNRVIGLEEKPASPKSPYAITGLYFVDGDAPEIAAQLKPSRRAETEIVDLLREYHRQDLLRAEILGRGLAWLDTGTPESMQEASSYIEAIEKRQGLKVACPEEIAFRLGFIDAEQLDRLAERCGASGYGEYLKALLSERASSG